MTEYTATIAAAALCASGALALADSGKRRPDATAAEIFAGPFSSSRLFSVPVADTVGPYILALSWDGSLLEEPGVLSSAGVLAIGFGDIAQLEYRHTAAISVGATNAPVPAAGIQLKAPFAERRHRPAIAAAFRLGVPREQRLGDLSLTETVTDLYLVSRLRLWGALSAITAHAGVRVSFATAEVGGVEPVDRALVLPSFGFEVRANPSAVLIGEVGLVPSFDLELDPGSAPTIGSGLQSRVGIRWFVHRAFSFDASLGFQVDNIDRSHGVGSVVDWDIRLGGELFIPWGAIACRSLRVFCNEGGNQ